MRDQRIAGDARTVPTAAQIMQIAGERRSHGPTPASVASSKPTNPCASSLFLVAGDTFFISQYDIMTVPVWVTSSRLILKSCQSNRIVHLRTQYEYVRHPIRLGST